MRRLTPLIPLVPAVAALLWLGHAFGGADRDAPAADDAAAPRPRLLVCDLDPWQAAGGRLTLRWAVHHGAPAERALRAGLRLWVEGRAYPPAACRSDDDERRGVLSFAPPPAPAGTAARLEVDARLLLLDSSVARRAPWLQSGGYWRLPVADAARPAPAWTLTRLAPEDGAVVDDLARPALVAQMPVTGRWRLRGTREPTAGERAAWRAEYRRGDERIAGRFTPRADAEWELAPERPLGAGRSYELMLALGPALTHRVVLRTRRDGVVQAAVANVDLDDRRRPDVLVLRHGRPLAWLAHDGALPLAPRPLAGTTEGFDGFAVAPLTRARELFLLTSSPGAAPGDEARVQTLYRVRLGDAADRPAAALGPQALHGATVSGLYALPVTQRRVADLLVLDFFGRSRLFTPADAGPGDAEPALIERADALSGALAGAVGAWPFDADGDGDQDLLVLRPGFAHALLVNDGGRLVPAPAALPVAAQTHWTHAVVTGDFDRDGRADLILFGDRAAALFLRGVGDGRFGIDPAATAALAALGRRIDAVVAADFNHDGALDLVVAHAQDGTLLCWGGAEGGFAAPEPLGALLGVGPLFAQALAAEDFDADGWLDLYLAAPEEDLFVTLPGRLRARPAVPALHAAPAPAAGFTPALPPADLDGDGVLELLARDGAVLRVRRADGQRHPWDGLIAPAWAAAAGAELRVTACDVDLDGLTDLLWLGAETGELWRRRTDDDRIFERRRLPERVRGGADLPALVRDFDGDGWAELLAAADDGGLALYRGGPAGWTEAGDLSAGLDPRFAAGAARAPAWEVTALAAADLTGNLLDDVLVTARRRDGEAAALWVLPARRGDAGLFDGARLVWETPRPAAPPVVAVGNLSGDVLDDLLVQPAEGPPFWLENRTRAGEPAFSDPRALPALPAPGLLGCADLDGDGFADLILCGAEGARWRLAVAPNAGGTFGAWVDQPAGEAPDDPADRSEPARIGAGDLSGRGRTELWVASGSRRLALWTATPLRRRR